MLDLLNLDFVQEALITLVIGILTWLITIVSRWLRNKGIITKLEANKELVRIAVLAVQQTYEVLDGKEKFEKAKEWILNEINKKGLKVDENEIDYLIEAVLKELKAEFGEDWWTKKEIK